MQEDKGMHCKKQSLLHEAWLCARAVRNYGSLRNTKRLCVKQPGVVSRFGNQYVELADPAEGLQESMVQFPHRFMCV